MNIPGQESRNFGYKTTGSDLFSTVGMWISNDGYVRISKNDNHSYSELTDDKIKLLNELDLLPNDLPESPTMSFFEILKGFGLWISLLLIISLVMLRSRNKKKKLEMLLLDTSEYERELIKIMGLMAYADGKIKNDEVETIQSIYEQVSDNKIEKEKIKAIPKLLDKDYSIELYAQKLSEKFTKDKKILLIKAASLIAMSDGKFADKEISFISNLTAELNVEEKEVLDIFKSMGLVDET